jgi:hypothetical protein
MQREFGDLQNLFAWDLDNMYLYYRKYIGRLRETKVTYSSLGRLKQNSQSVNILSLEAAHTFSGT